MTGELPALLSGRTTIRVRYPETDRMGRVHHAHFLVWFEIGRTELMRAAGCSYSQLEEDGVWMPVVDVSCRYIGAARYDDLVTVETWLEAVPRVTARLVYRASRAEDGALLATGSTRHAATDLRGVPRRLPERFLALLPATPGVR